VRRFNLAKSAVADSGNKEGVGGGNVPPRPTRLLLLTGLLIVVVAFAARDFVGRLAGVVTPQARQVAPPPVVPPVSTAVPEPRGPGQAGPSLAPGSSPDTPPAPRRETAGESAQPKGVEPQTPAEPRQGRFAVQVGAMAKEANALALLKRLQEAGYTSTIRKGGGSVTQHVVLVATPADRAEADAVLERLRAEGVSGRVSESEGGYRVEAGRSIALDEAIDLARDLQGKGFTTRIDSKTVGATLYLVRVGNLMSLADARRTGQKLREKGFPVLIVKK